jgi:hypothetical protein
VVVEAGQSKKYGAWFDGASGWFRLIKLGAAPVPIPIGNACQLQPWIRLAMQFRRGTGYGGADMGKIRQLEKKQEGEFMRERKGVKMPGRLPRD